MNTFVEVAPSLWRSPLDFKVMPGFYLTTHMTIIRSSTGALCLHSPAKLSASQEAQLQELGEVTHIVAPNLFHYAAFNWARQRYPKAQALAPKQLHSKVPAIAGYTPLEQADTALLPDSLALPVGGIPSLNEWVFLHSPSRTLILTDLLFNVQERHGLLTPLILWLGGTSRGVAFSRLLQRSVKDAELFRNSLQRILTLDFDRVLMAHGAVIESGGKAALRAALGDWL